MQCNVMFDTQDVGTVLGGPSPKNVSHAPEYLDLFDNYSRIDRPLQNFV